MAARLTDVRSTLPGQLGGPVGTLEGYGSEGLAVSEAFGRAVGLPMAGLAWHTARIPISDAAGALGSACGVISKVALDICLLAQSEVAEVREGGSARGGSSSMPHKHNPIAATCARASAIRAPGLVATLLSAMAQEHERAAGSWHAEWETLSDLLRVTGNAAAWLRDCLEHLDVEPARMAANLAVAADELAGAALAAALAPAIGRTAAHDLVAAAAATARAAGRSLPDVLAEQPDLPLTPNEIRRLAAPQTGSAAALVDRALARRPR